MESLNFSVKNIKGIGEKKYGRLKSMGIRTIGDALYYFPRSYEDKSRIFRLSECQDKQRATLRMIVTGKSSYRKNGRDILKVSAMDESGDKCSLFFFNSKFLEARLETGGEYLFYGQVSRDMGSFSCFYPEYADVKDSSSFLRIHPLYPLVSGITNGDIRGIVSFGLSHGDVRETLPDSVVERHGLVGPLEALRGIHFPGGRDEYRLSRDRIVFEEFFNFMVAMMLIKGKYNSFSGVSIEGGDDEMALMKTFVDALPYRLTVGQENAWNDARRDMSSGYAMNRLIQGDVGAGKTIVAILAAFYASLSGYQSMVMSPTEILAQQHCETFGEMAQLFGKATGRSVRVELLTSSVKKRRRDELLKSLRGDGDEAIDILVGTHALLQEDVVFSNLGLVVTDEQHRFGVRQRSVAVKKGSSSADKAPNVIVMSATPIPRTLSLILYGDMDITTIYDMPEGRKTVKTHYVKKSKEMDMYGFIGKEFAKGRQAYFVCPLIEESEVTDANDVMSIHGHLSEVFPERRIGLIHGRMKADEKEAVMARFKNGDMDGLVSTTVIEVGVNVPSATVMVIYNCERFGLSQLHQLRGRVGRGSDQAWCFLLVDKASQTSMERVKTLCESSSGFDIAMKDLDMRGTGEMLGSRQHGNMDFKLANVVKHKEILEKAQKEALEYVKESGRDPKKRDELFKKAIDMFDEFSI